jgi:hypothetical protein
MVLGGLKIESLAKDGNSITTAATSKPNVTCALPNSATRGQRSQLYFGGHSDTDSLSLCVLAEAPQKT